MKIGDQENLEDKIEKLEKKLMKVVDQEYLENRVEKLVKTLIVKNIKEQEDEENKEYPVIDTVNEAVTLFAKAFKNISNVIPGNIAKSVL
ncbi:18403_t:CDS:2, partial [Racocetra fulgida]